MGGDHGWVVRCLRFKKGGSRGTNDTQSLWGLRDSQATLSRRGGVCSVACWDALLRGSGAHGLVIDQESAEETEERSGVMGRERVWGGRSTILVGDGGVEIDGAP